MSEPLRLAAVTTAFYPRSHADVLLARWMEPRAGDAAWGWPRQRSRIVSAYIAQFPTNPQRPDVGRELCARAGVPLHDSVAGALTCGGTELAVDGVLLVGEHGDYPWNELEQHLYPRKELFDQIVAVYRASGRTAPVFCDKHLSWNFAWAREMAGVAEELGFQLIAGSSLPHCRLQPPVDLSGDPEISEAVAVFFGGDESYGFHSVEFVQSLVERRRGGESGVVEAIAWRGPEVWRAMDRGEWPAELLEVALAAMDDRYCSSGKALKPGDYRVNSAQGEGKPTAFRVRYADGLKVTHLNLSGHAAQWGVGMRMAGEREPLATCPWMDGNAGHHAHFATMARIIEDAMLTGRPTFAPQRSLLTTGIIGAAMQALARPGEPVARPDLRLAYRSAKVIDGEWPAVAQ